MRESAVALLIVAVVLLALGLSFIVLRRRSRSRASHVPQSPPAGTGKYDLPEPPPSGPPDVRDRLESQLPQPAHTGDEADKRPSYFDGKLLDSDDFADEQQYQIRKDPPDRK
jgi:uncharacterized membrane protein YecN with MAPEG domain